MDKEGGEKEREERIEATVVEILKEADMESVTEHKVRAMAAERLALDLSVPHRKKIVRKAVESFLLSHQEQQEDQQQQEDQDGADSIKGEQEEEDEQEEEEEQGKKKKHYGHDDNGDLILCNLNNKRRVTLQDFKGKTLVSIREYYDKDGKQLPTTKGISLTADQWRAFRDVVPRIKDAIEKKLQG